MFIIPEGVDIVHCSFTRPAGSILQPSVFPVSPPQTQRRPSTPPIAETSGRSVLFLAREPISLFPLHRLLVSEDYRLTTLRHSGDGRFRCQFTFVRGADTSAALEQKRMLEWQALLRSFWTVCVRHRSGDHNMIVHLGNPRD